MSQTANPNDHGQFAFGANEHEDCVCPAVAAGYNPESSHRGGVPGLLEVAETYDLMAEDHHPDYFGVISEDEAKESWLKMMNEVEDREGKNSDQYHAARKVADELGWLDEE